MCGIVGFVGRGSKDDIARMTAAVRHRGPDSEGIYVGDGVALGHTRLSIIDTSNRGAQPMTSPDGRYIVVFNGEIYNFKELRKRAGDWRFQSDSDTEVILALFSRFGAGSFKHLRGMFALAVYDTHEGALILARDRMGKKPLYYALCNDTLIFGSELKALRAHPLLSDARISPEAFEEYAQNDCVLTPRTIYQDVYKLEPGWYAYSVHGKIDLREYWQLPTGEQDIPFDEALERLDHLLAESVRLRLVSDVPLGVWLSGGLDSSLVAAHAMRAADQPIATFSIGFTESSFDESPYAAQVAQHLGTRHYHNVVTPAMVRAVIERMPDIFDEPVADASVLPTFLLSAFTREQVKVALGGDGGDELFAGYPTFQADYLARIYHVLPSVFKCQIARVVGNLPAGDTYLPLATKLQTFTRGFAPTAIVRHREWLGSFSGNELDKLLSRPPAQEGQSGGSFEGGSNALLSWYLRRYLMDQVLVKTDRASMAHGLELRAPFLDHELVAFAHTLPYVYKLRYGITKYILKKHAQHLLPRTIVNRPKQGFAVPVASWMRGPLSDMVEEVLDPAQIKRGGLMNADYVEQLKQEHYRGTMNHGKKLWNLFVFEQWRRRYA